MSYTVRCKKPGSILSRTFKNVIGDGLIWFEDRNRNQQVVQARYLILDDRRRIEIPFTVIIEFSREREAVIRDRMSQESGQAINVEGGKTK